MVNCEGALCAPNGTLHCHNGKEKQKYVLMCCVSCLVGLQSLDGCRIDLSLGVASSGSWGLIKSTAVQIGCCRNHSTDFTTSATDAAACMVTTTAATTTWVISLFLL